MWQQFPCSFEFNERFLSDLADAVYSGQYGTFLFNSEQQRAAVDIRGNTVSFWAHVEAHQDDYRSLHFRPREVNNSVILPHVGVRRMKLWPYHHRWNFMMCQQENPMHQFEVRAVRLDVPPNGLQLCAVCDLYHPPQCELLPFLLLPHSNPVSFPNAHDRRNL